ncbi:serine hydrolase domain-containing protein [Corynebacterium sp.]|uniref:serine hydrolase domain-containing protein n=1 Tax=Corynebacterium sp. TaxID=1720 RepID=UPI002A910D39|nr:serine hydrolase domain-containing protein [Corynebacterium sp.]MDY5784760.1 serine hydrolase domain-containing protein [Corynebacterium sp.]
MSPRVIGIAAALVTAAVLATAGPRPVSLATQETGDQAIASSLAAEAVDGQHNLAAFTYDDGRVTFGGLGADADTEFEVGSLTKTFNAELTRQLVEEGKVSLDTTVGEIVDVGEAPLRDVRLEELLNHTSGLASMESLSVSELLLARVRDGGNAYRRDTPEQILRAARDAELSGRGQYSYSNYGHALLGQLLAHLTATPYPELVRTRILEPAGMTDTYLATPGANPDAPRGFGPDGRPAEPWDMDGWAPAGAIRSTPADMAKYVDWVARHGRPDYGWLDRDMEGKQYPYHNGGTEGFRTVIVWDPEPGSRRAAFVAGDTGVGVEKQGVALVEAMEGALP